MTESITQVAQQACEAVQGAGLQAPERILFGPGQSRRLAEISASFAVGRKALIVVGGEHALQSGLAEQTRAALHEHDVEAFVFSGVDQEPTVEIVDRAAERARSFGAALVVCLGGGSVIDCAKAVAAMAENEGSVRDYLEGLGTGRQIVQDPLPVVAVPTSVGTGAEMTKNAVIGVPERGLKRSLRHALIMPRVAVIDPELTFSAPAHVTAQGGMDAVTQLIESCISVRRRQETTRFALLGLRWPRTALRDCVSTPANAEAREAMALASMLGGFCLANSGLGLVHGLASGLGESKQIPHGLLCGILLPHVLDYNREACTEQLSECLAAFLNETAADTGTIDRGIASLKKLNETLGIPPDLRHLSIREEELPTLAERSMGNSMRGNPVPMTVDSVVDFLRSVS